MSTHIFAKVFGVYNTIIINFMYMYVPGIYSCNNYAIIILEWMINTSVNFIFLLLPFQVTHTIYMYAQFLLFSVNTTLINSGLAYIHVLTCAGNWKRNSETGNGRQFCKATNEKSSEIYYRPTVVKQRS